MDLGGGGGDNVLNNSIKKGEKGKEEKYRAVHKKNLDSEFLI
jgi:hypothetical protein